jgi:hypothetical protein
MSVINKQTSAADQFESFHSFNSFHAFNRWIRATACSFFQGLQPDPGRQICPDLFYFVQSARIFSGLIGLPQRAVASFALAVV